MDSSVVLHVLDCAFLSVQEKGKYIFSSINLAAWICRVFHTAHSNFSRRGARSESSSATQSSSPSSSYIFRRKNIRRWGAEYFSRKTTKIGNNQKFAICAALTYAANSDSVRNERKTRKKPIVTVIRLVMMFSRLVIAFFVDYCDDFNFKFNAKHDRNYECLRSEKKFIAASEKFFIRRAVFHPKRKTLNCRPLIFLIKY